MSKNIIPEHVTVQIQSPNLNYINEFLKLRCASDLVATKLLNNAKEISRSMAAYAAARRHLRRQFSADDPTVTAIVLGDGERPVTGTLVAFRTQWNVVSVDERMMHHRWNIFRLSTYVSSMKDVANSMPSLKKVVVFAMDGMTDEVLEATKLAPEFAIVALTEHEELHSSTKWVSPSWTYEDPNIWSHDRTVRVWRF